MREGWVETTLGAVADRTIGRTPPRKAARYWSVDPGDRPFLTIADMQSRSVDGGREGVTELAEREGVAKRVPAGSLLLSFKLTLGRVGITSRDVFPNEAIAWLRPRSGILRDYLAIALEGVDWTVLGGRAVKGKTLNKQSLDAVPLVVPPLAEQRRFIDLIGALDDSIAATGASGCRIYHFLGLLRDVYLWDVDDRVRLEDLCVVDGSLVSPVGEYALLPHVGTDRIVSGTGDLVGVVSASEDGVVSGKYVYDERHVIYSKIRPNLRKVALPVGLGLCSADAYPLLPGRGVPRRYLQQLLLSRPFTEVAVSRSGRTKMPKINRTELLSIEVTAHAPARMAELAAQFDALEYARRTLLAELDSLRALRSNLLTVLLSGEHEIPASYDALIEDVA